MRNHWVTETEHESQTLVSLRNRFAPYTPVLVAAILGEAVFAMGLWFRTTIIDAVLASSVMLFISLVGYRFLEERGR